MRDLENNMNKVAIIVIAVAAMLTLSGCVDESTIKKNSSSTSPTSQYSTSSSSEYSPSSNTQRSTSSNTQYSTSPSSEYSSSSNTQRSTSSTSQYIENRNSRKLHSAHCDSLPYPKNRLYFDSIEEAHSAGYTDHHKECMGVN